MHLGHVWIAPEEIERIGWRDGRLRLDLRWQENDLPVLLGLSRPTRLNWFEDDPKAGLPVELQRWTYCTESGRLRLTLRC